jgi:hypothetical protein
MKRTIPLFSSFWAKAVSVAVLFFVITMTNMQAQNYKPLDEAMASVEAAIVELKASQTAMATLSNNNSDQQRPSGMTQTQSQVALTKLFEVSYYTRFLELAKINGDVAEAVTALNSEFPSQGQPQSRLTIMTTAKAELLHLITY